MADSKPRPRRIAIIGGGPGGLCAGVRLRAAGYEDFTIFEASAGVGGTWYNTRYPGLACDVQSHLYAFSFAPNPDWSRTYVTQPEICDYMGRVADEFGLRPHLRLNTKVTEAHWDEPAAEWRLVTQAGDEPRFDIVIAALGMFNDLAWPEIEGLEAFNGTMFHAARWNPDHDLTGRRVAVIGSAASAVQFVPEIAPKVAQLYVHQRSAPWVSPKEDPPYDQTARERFAQDPAVVETIRQKLYRGIEGFISFGPEQLAQGAEAGLANLQAVKDADLRAKLTPTAPFGCMRPLLTSDYYSSFNRDNVELVTSPIVRVVQDRVVTEDGAIRPVDTLICATGYQVRKFLSAIEVTGRAGRRIAQDWKDGAEAYLGLMTTGYPNLFQMYGPNTNNGSITFMLECQAEFILNHLALMDRENLAWIDVKPEVQARYNHQLQQDLDRITVWQAGCHNYYREPSGRNVTQWPHNMTTYRDACVAVDGGIFEA